MKRHIIFSAILALTATQVVLAQSSATLYGTIDMGYSVGNNGLYEGQDNGINSKFQQWGNGRTTSVWGLTGMEDLGHGNKIYFTLESAFNPESGANDDDDRFFGEAAYIGFESKFGSLQAGRQSTVHSNILSEFDVSGAPNLTSALGNAGISGDAQKMTDDYVSTLDSALIYISPNFSGFSFQAGLALKNDDFLQEGEHGKNLYTLGLTYEWQGLLIGASFESKPVDSTLYEASSSWGVGAKYDFGSFIVAASYFDNHNDYDGKGFSLGVSVPFNAFEFGAQVAYNRDALAYETDDKVKPLAWELYATYSLSNRTQLYAQYGGMDSDAQKFNNAARKYSAGFGIIHNF